MIVYFYVLQKNFQPEWRNLHSLVTSHGNIFLMVNGLHLHSSTLQCNMGIHYLASCCYVLVFFQWGCDDSRTNTKGHTEGCQLAFCLGADIFKSYIFSILSDEFLPHRFSPLVFFFASWYLADTCSWLLIWLLLNVGRFTLDNLLWIKWIRASEIWEIPLVNAKLFFRCS